MEIFEDNFTLQNKQIRDFIKLNFHASLRFYDDLEVKYKRKYFMYLKGSNNPLPPDMWYIEWEYKRYEYSFEEIASILNLKKSEVINIYVKAMKKLRLMCL